MSVIHLDELKNIRERHKGKIIVYCSGSFDLTHAGHALFFEDCKKQGDILVVSVGDDATMREYKGEKRPVLNEHLRLKMVDSMKPVDYAFVGFHVPGDKFGGAEREVENLRPDVYVINEDAYDVPRRRRLAERFGIKLVILKRTSPPEFEEISATKIIEKVKNL